jgi:hypothetical protein
MKFLSLRNFRFVVFVQILGSTISIFGQSSARQSPPEGSMFESPFFLFTAILAIAALATAFFIYRVKSKGSVETSMPDPTGRNIADSKARPKGSRLRPYISPEPQDIRTSTKANADRYSRMAAQAAATSNFASRSKTNLAGLPISLVLGLQLPAPINELEVSDDESLLNAIDECQDDSDADSEFRNLAIRVLAAFKTRNSVETLSQIALYDLSSGLRSKAVSILADFDHESVFDAIVLSCADPSREVRAAGAKGLFRLSFDRADAWARIAITENDLLARQIARAAVEAGLAERYFDRLVHRDETIVYEAFALVFLLIRTSETEVLINAIQSHRDLSVRLALLHVFKVANIPDSAKGLRELIDSGSMPPDIEEAAKEITTRLSVVYSA